LRRKRPRGRGKGKQQQQASVSETHGDMMNKIPKTVPTTAPPEEADDADETDELHVCIQLNNSCCSFIH